MQDRLKALVVHSGGLDSTVLLYEMIRDFDVKWTFGLDYGQRHVRELRAAYQVVSRLGLSRYTRSIDFGFRSSSQTSEDIPVPEGHYTAENMAMTVVPNRNMILLSIAAAVAMDRGIDIVAYGAHAGDHVIYPDCRPEFVEAFEKTVALATDNKVHLFAPFMNVTKAEIVRRGLELGVPFELTWTCYQGAEISCGRCGTCVERLEAFALNDAEDPLEYEDREFYKQVTRVQ